MREWSELTALEQAANLYSDAHKDAYGFRPRNGGVHNPQTLAEYEAAISECSETMMENEARERVFEARALARLESEVSAIQSEHGLDHATATRWWFEAEGFQEPVGECTYAYNQEAEMILYARGIAFSAWPAIIAPLLQHYGKGNNS